MKLKAPFLLAIFVTPPSPSRTRSPEARLLPGHAQSRYLARLCNSDSLEPDIQIVLLKLNRGKAMP